MGTLTAEADQAFEGLRMVHTLTGVFSSVLQSSGISFHSKLKELNLWNAQLHKISLVCLTFNFHPSSAVGLEELQKRKIL